MSSNRKGLCPTKKDLENYLFGSLSQDGSYRIEQHLRICDRCHEIIQRVLDIVGAGIATIPKGSVVAPEMAIISHLLDTAPEATVNHILSQYPFFCAN